MPDFKQIQLKPMTGVFDTLSSLDEIGYGNFRLVKNATTRATRNRQRAGGWRKLFSEHEDYNNEDLHDQLTGRLGFYDSYNGHAMGGGGLAGYSYPYFFPNYSTDSYEIHPPAAGPYCPVYIGDHTNYTYLGCDVFYPFIGFPWRYIYLDPSICTSGYPHYFAESFLYVSCPTEIPGTFTPGYVYGVPSPFYSPMFGYDYVYCGAQFHNRSGCREAITLLDEIVTSTGRKLIASTMSRVYELNQSSGNWSLLADGLGNAGYTVSQCGCNDVRGVSATIGGWFVYTNNFDAPMIYFVGDARSGCEVRSLQVITDLDALGITKAGGVVSWNGFTLFFDITEDGERKGNVVIWSDLNDPNSYIEGDSSFAGQVTLAPGQTVLAAAPLGNWLMLYTDKAIIRVTLVGGEDVFNFEEIYRGGNAMKYKFSLINAGDMHIYLGESDVYVFTQFDTRPITVGWITRASGMIFNGISEDDAVYSSINKEACDLVTGGWSEEKREAWLSWPTGDNICPDVTLRFNMKFNTADMVDHGFTAFMTFRPDERPTVGQWIEDMGICPRGSQVATEFKDGPVCPGNQIAVSNPPMSIRNETENPDLPPDEDSLCARLAGLTMDDFCRDCASPAKFITASAEDFTLKQQEDDIGYREMLGGSSQDYDSYACAGEYYTYQPYDTVIQEGAEKYKSDDEKMIKRITVEAEPLPSSSPLMLEGEVAYGSQPSCMTWRESRPLVYECQTERTQSEHLAMRSRQDGVFSFPVWRRGVYISTRFRISGIGGLGTLSGLHKMLKVWGQQESP